MWSDCKNGRIQTIHPCDKTRQRISTFEKIFQKFGPMEWAQKYLGQQQADGPIDRQTGELWFKTKIELIQKIIQNRSV